LDYRMILEHVLESAKSRGYKGYSKFDALNSPMLSTFSMGNSWLRLLFIQAVKCCPFNIRPLLGVGKSVNPKGIALFAQAYLTLHELTGVTAYREEAERLLDWLLEHPSPGRRHLSWGYDFIWQSPLFLQDRYEPNVVVTIFAGEALVHGYRVTGEARYIEAARSAARFILEDVPVIYQGDDEMAIAYVLRDVKAVVLNNNALAGAFLAKVRKETGGDDLRDAARRLMAYTVNCRTDYHAWYYTYPKEASPITHDNYHTGGILDALLEYREETGDVSFADVYTGGLDYYRKNLFEPDGAPRWMNDRRYPHDVHGAAQGIITFSKASRYDRENLVHAKKIASWAQQNLYRPATGDYAYRKGCLMTWNYSLMRWCNAWMARALGELAAAETAETGIR